MPKRGNPNYARRLRLAAELRRLREDAGLTGQDVRDSLGWPSGSKLSRIENGQSGVKQPDLAGLLDLYGVSGEHRDQLFALAEESQEGGPPAAGARMPEEHQQLLDAERDADSLWIWEPYIFPGLFQTDGYTKALFLDWVQLFAMARTEVDRRIESRRLRQEVLTRQPPPRLSAVIDESVLYRCVGDAAVMREQIDRAIEISLLPGVEIRILPLGGPHPIGTGAFNYIKFRQIHAVPLDDLVAFEHLTGTTYPGTEDDRHRYLLAFEALMDNGLGPAASRDLMTRAKDTWSRETTPQA